MINVFMDDIRQPEEIYPGLQREWVTCRRVEQVLVLLEAGVVHDMSLDHDMGEGAQDGSDLIRHMESCDLWPSGTITVHSANPVAASSMRAAIDARCRVMWCVHGTGLQDECGECEMEKLR